MAVDTNKLYSDVHSLDSGNETCSIGQTREIAANTIDCLALIYHENPGDLVNLLGGRDINRVRRALAAESGPSEPSEE